MRWDNLTTAADEAARLPGHRDPATVRRFDAPEALDMRFYEIHAKSAINRVPNASQMPFRWTINPYRGCSHACVYCLAGETPILMGDGRHLPLRQLSVGDEIYGTAGEGQHRRYVRTRVLAHWSTIKPAYRARWPTAPSVGTPPLTPKSTVNTRRRRRSPTKTLDPPRTSLDDESRPSRRLPPPAPTAPARPLARRDAPARDAT